MPFDREIFDEARREFLSHLLYAKGHGKSTCYAYNGDLGLWANWLTEAGKDWQRAKPTDVEQFAAWQLRERKVSAHIVNRRLSALSSFYRWALRHEIAESDPVYLADKPKRPLRIPVWLEKEEQSQFEATLKDRHNIPINIFGDNKAKMTETRRRYEMLFGLLLNSGLRIGEALGLKTADVRILDGLAKSVRVIGKGDKERLVPLPRAFGEVFGFWLKDRPKGEYVFARAVGQKAVSRQSAGAYLRLMLKKAGIDKKISAHKLRHTYATNLLNAGAELVDIKTLLGHESVATTQIYTNVGQERMEKVVGRL
ncbi:MAG: tyrosine-type recombinase/integrase [Candidatus Competibacteraceae bacterium]|nr:tyrosine-type recombinase/integrase [Candidatus Competibacteraceae bacterium]